VADSLAGTWPAYWRTLEEVVYGTDVPALLARVRAPVTVIHGPHDTVAPVSRVRELAAALPALRLVEIAGAGHNPYYSHRAATLAALEAALTG
jgi:pimeloyl-[acyl-carrier protein] methyl ester esterase